MENEVIYFTIQEYMPHYVINTYCNIFIKWMVVAYDSFDMFCSKDVKNYRLGVKCQIELFLLWRFLISNTLANRSLNVKLFAFKCHVLTILTHCTVNTFNILSLCTNDLDLDTMEEHNYVIYGYINCMIDRRQLKLNGGNANCSTDTTSPSS